MSQRQPATDGSAAARSAAGGSHGSRGFRYQGEVAAAVAVMGLIGQLSIRSITCEYPEDVAVVAGTGTIHAQVKSRRAHLAPHTAGWVAKQIAALLSRHHDALERDPTRTVAIVLESLTDVLEPTGWSATIAPGTATYAELAAADSFTSKENATDPAQLDRVHLVHAPRPPAAAVQLLAHTQAMLPAVAELCVARLRQALSDAADASGESGRTYPATLTATELQRLRPSAIATFGCSKPSATIAVWVAASGSTRRVTDLAISTSASSTRSTGEAPRLLTPRPPSTNGLLKRCGYDDDRDDCAHAGRFAHILMPHHSPAPYDWQ